MSNARLWFLVLGGVCVALSCTSVLLWYLHCPLSVGPATFIRSDNRDLLDTDEWNWGFTYQVATDDIKTPAKVVKSSEHLRVVGGGHSFAPLAATSGTYMSPINFWGAHPYHTMPPLSWSLCARTGHSFYVAA